MRQCESKRSEVENAAKTEAPAYLPTAPLADRLAALRALVNAGKKTK
jgi:hypothetical protein